MHGLAQSGRRVLGGLRRLLSEDRGASMPIVAAVLVPLMGFVGLATDAARAYVVKARLGDALDAAGLASAHEVFASDFSTQVEQYFKANFPDGYLGADVTLGEPQLSNNNNVLTLTASAEINTTFMRLFGFNSLNIVSSTEVTRLTSSLDVVLSMDMSGSMGNSDGSGSTRIAAARSAAKEMIDILFGSSESKDLLQVGLVPWNGKVNVTLNGGPAFNPTLTDPVSVPTFTNPVTGLAQTQVYYANNSPVPLLVPPPSGWDGCVNARYIDGEDENQQGDVWLGPETYDETDWFGWEPNTLSRCLSHGITPLQSTQTDINDAIDELLSPDHVTNIAQGLAWAWRVVSPGAPFDQADPNPKGNHQRAIVLLTDGEQWGNSRDAYKAVFGSGSSAGPNGQNDRLRELATNIKREGIRIFVIQFYYDSGSLANLMKDVASGSGAPYYHFAPDGDALRDAFTEVADELSALRISR